MFGVVDPPPPVVVPEVMVWVRVENSDRECSIYFHAHLQGASEPTKKAAAHIGTAAFARSFVRELRGSRASTGSSRLQSNHRGYSQPGWQTTALAAAIPNAWLIKLNRGSDGKTSVCHSAAAGASKLRTRAKSEPQALAELRCNRRSKDYSVGK